MAFATPTAAAVPRVLYHVTERTHWSQSERSAERLAVADSRSSRPTDSESVAGNAPSTGDEHVVLAGPDASAELANRLFGGRRDIVLLFIDSSRLSGVLREDTVHGVRVYLHPSPLQVSAVFEVADLPTDQGARFVAHHETAALVAHGDDTLADARERALRATDGWNRPWWIAGGWALDLHLGTLTRPHADLEVSILRSDQTSLYAHLAGWDLRAVAPGSRLVPWDGTPLEAPYHQIWARRGPGGADTIDEFVSDPTMLDFLIEDHVGEQWCYRRDHRVTRDVRDIGATRDGLPYIRPEIALLYKAKQPRYKDSQDFQHVLPHLTSDARKWLRAALELAHPRAVSLSVLRA